MTEHGSSSRAGHVGARAIKLRHGRPAESESVPTGAVAALQAQEEPSRLSAALCALAEVQGAAGNIDAARRSLDEAVTLRRKIMSPTHPALAAVERQLSELTARKRVTR